jgi:hypothetical protein
MACPISQYACTISELMARTVRARASSRIVTTF